MDTLDVGILRMRCIRYLDANARIRYPAISLVHSTAGSMRRWQQLKSLLTRIGSDTELPHSMHRATIIRPITSPADSTASSTVCSLLEGISASGIVRGFV